MPADAEGSYQSHSGAFSVFFSPTKGVRGSHSHAQYLSGEASTEVGSAMRSFPLDESQRDWKLAVTSDGKSYLVSHDQVFVNSVEDLLTVVPWRTSLGE